MKDKLPHKRDITAYTPKNSRPRSLLLQGREYPSRGSTLFDLMESQEILLL